MTKIMYYSDKNIVSIYNFKNKMNRETFLMNPTVCRIYNINYVPSEHMAETNICRVYIY